MDPSSNTPTGSAETGRSQSTGSIPTALLHPTLSRESTSSTATITPKTDSWPSKLTSQTSATSTSSSAAPSPLHSREPSPTRPQQRTSSSRASSINAGPRSRKNSTQDLSPSRSGKQTNPPLLPTSKALSSSTTPTLLPSVSDPSFNAGAPVKSPTSMEHLRESPRWPVSPRLRSPPPILHQPNIPPQRRSEHETPLIALQRATPPPPRYQEPQSDTDTDDAQLPTGLRTPARGGGGSSSTLETVQEVSPLGSPRGPGESLEEKLAGSMASESSQADLIGLGLSKEVVGKSSSGPNDSGSDSGSIKASRRGGSGMPPPPLTTRQSSTSIKPSVSKTKTGELPLQSMTVETETVTSIPQAALAPSVGTQVSSASLRTKPSNETIRPRKEKKKPPRKQPTVTAVNASSKADIFEAKVASAVEEANSSDSEETFVYDSNPPDARDRPPRFHSRTPSATSMVSQIDRTGMRSIHTVMESAGPQMVVKKSMKFVNTYNSSANEGVYGDDDGKGTSRSNAGSARGTARHHHHFGRWGRNGGGNGHPSLFAEHSPFSNVAAAGNGSSRHSSNPPSPRYANARNYSATNGKRSTHLSAGYDLDDNTTGADDETTPLVQSSTIRSSRSGRSRRGPHSHSYRSIEAQQYRSPPSVLNRFASCLVLTVMLLLIVSGAIGFMFATSQPLTNVQLTNMSNIVASQQELMLDLTIKAHNPNVVVVAVDSCNIEVFAKSPRAMSDSEWWRHTHPGEVGPPPIKRPGGEMVVMEADDDDDSAPNLHLGTITGFESPLTFEGSFFNQGDSYSTGEVRLKDPGNDTKPGGPERWERVLEDEFTLILKGVITYTLPLSQRERKATITAKKTIRPNSADDPVVQPDPANDDEVTISLIS
ncbi:vacuolar segregation subunit 7-domain-containing protein [Apiosordaria backusii]|uniref:Vacuolar segregation subunit 7-domain-containing protein n=1 Tax=Apiosordaria backusii TaxID=314023 RepID=A0AA40DQY8_9PEZI|nr:vacuolar segregation subunit 7-domain-containing protein [Apiosordaria backusii]